ncbi:hypothetical protein A0H81_10924 [Grifola frondosa]|uniref:Uncharacterized protein n=1 Tax=Grifola frondosa TaxID=5627 RepID=A0A1C7LYQ4_GRIFR|nr:hypothetical protein A0H81_10924 [Grifola frondosa]
MSNTRVFLQRFGTARDRSCHAFVAAFTTPSSTAKQASSYLGSLILWMRCAYPGHGCVAYRRFRSRSTCIVHSPNIGLLKL